MLVLYIYTFVDMETGFFMKLFSAGLSYKIAAPLGVHKQPAIV